VLGMLVGYGFCRLVFRTIGDYFYFEYLGNYSVAPVAVLWTVICMVVATCYAMIAPVQKLYSLNPIEALRRADEINSPENILANKSNKTNKKTKQKKAAKRKSKQDRKSDRLTKRFGIETGYAYRNLMRTRSRFLLVAVTLTIGGSFYIGGSTFSKLLSDGIYGSSSMYDEYSGYFSCDDAGELKNIKKDLDSLKCVSNGKTFAEVTLEWSTEKPDDGKAADNAELTVDTIAENTAYFIGLEQTDYEALLSECGVDAPDDNSYNVIQVENSVEDGFVIPFKSKHELNIQATVLNSAFYDFASEVNFFFWQENYKAGCPIYVYLIDSGFEALFDAGLSDDLYLADVQSGYTYNICVNEFASDYYKFENYIDNTTHRYVDMTMEIRLVISIFRLVKLAINTVIVLVLLIFFINSINIQHSQMLLREDEFSILRIIGMSKKQLKKSLMIENMAGVVAAAFWSVVLGTIGGNVFIRALEWLDQIDDEVKDYSPFTVDIKSVGVVILLLLFLGFVSAVIASNTDENSKH
jgi:ABC-type antimicrobial peptide transport system permease subunit